MNIYISGPISGQDKQRARDRFCNAARIIEEAGHNAINPIDISEWGLDWSTYMQIAFDVLKSGDVDSVYMLSGWEESNGASLERYMAIVQGIPVQYQNKADREKFGRAHARKGLCKGKATEQTALCDECEEFYRCEILEGM